MHVRNGVSPTEQYPIFCKSKDFSVLSKNISLHTIKGWYIILLRSSKERESM